MNYEKIGEFVKEKRKAIHLTQKDLAKIAEVSHRSVVTIEAGGKISLDTLKKMLIYLGYDLTVTDKEHVEIIDFR